MAHHKSDDGAPRLLLVDFQGGGQSRICFSHQEKNRGARGHFNENRDGRIGSVSACAFATAKAVGLLSTLEYQLKLPAKLCGPGQ